LNGFFKFLFTLQRFDEPFLKQSRTPPGDLSNRQSAYGLMNGPKENGHDPAHFSR
jgi:hypothetical protein